MISTEATLMNTVPADYMIPFIKRLEKIGYSYNEALLFCQEQCNLFPIGAVEKKIAEMERRKILENHPYKITKSFYTSNGHEYPQYSTRVFKNGKSQVIKKKSREELERYLLDYYGEIEEPKTLESFFNNEWKIFREQELASPPKTLENDIWSWNTFFKGTEIADVPMSKITPAMIASHFRRITNSHPYDRKRVTNTKSLLNGMFGYAIELGIVNANPNKDVDYKRFQYKQQQNKTDNVYTEEDALKLLTDLKTKEDTYALAIRLMFTLVIAIGELKALRWQDIDFDRKKVYIHTQIIESKNKYPDSPDVICVKKGKNRYYTHVNHVKKRIAARAREEELNDNALEVLRILKERSTSEYLFLENEMFLITNTFNDHLRRHCNACGAKYHSSHKIRFLNGTTFYKATDDVCETQKAFGHEGLGMTYYYLSRNTGDNEGSKKGYNALNRLHNQ